MPSYKERDIEVWRQWKRASTPTNLQAVLNQLNPVVQREVNRWTGTLARAVLELEAKRLATEAIKSFRETAGASLATHVTNRLKKLSRLSYTHQNIARIPEYQTLKYHTYESAKAELVDGLGRDPTHIELADELGWSKGALRSFERNLRREFVESGETPPYFDQGEGAGGMVDFIYYDLAPMQKKIFEHTTGYGGKKVLDNPQLMKKLKLTQGQLSYQKRLMTDKIERVISEKKW